VVVFPSVLVPLVISSISSFLRLAVYRMFVASVRYASETGLLGSLTITSLESSVRFQFATLGTIASTGAPSRRSTSSRPPIRSSNRSRRKATPMPSPKPMTRPRTPLRILLGLAGDVGAVACCTITPLPCTAVALGWTAEYWSCSVPSLLIRDCRCEVSALSTSPAESEVREIWPLTVSSCFLTLSICRVTVSAATCSRWTTWSVRNVM
jgi:hypothetical protein